MLIVLCLVSMLFAIPLIGYICATLEFIYSFKHLPPYEVVDIVTIRVCSLVVVFGIVGIMLC